MPVPFVFGLAVTWALGAIVVAHIGKYFFNVVESSTAVYARNRYQDGRVDRPRNADAVVWEEEPIGDFFLHGLVLLYLAALCFSPAFLLGRFAMGGTTWAMVIAAAVVWLVFPVVVLSSLAADSRWTPWHPKITLGMARRPIKVLAFYLVSASPVALIALTVDVIMVQPERIPRVWWTVLAAASAFAILIYARLIGRLGMVVTFAIPPEIVEEKPAPRPRKGRRTRPVNAYDPRHRFGLPTEAGPDEPTGTTQPSDLPALQTPFDGPVSGYDVRFDEPPPTPQPEPAPRGFKAADDAPIEMAPDELGHAARRDVAAIERTRPFRQEFERHLRKKPKEPANPFGLPVVRFLADGKAVEALLRIGVGLVLMVLAQRFLDSVRPNLSDTIS